MAALGVAIEEEQSEVEALLREAGARAVLFVSAVRSRAWKTRRCASTCGSTRNATEVMSGCGITPRHLRWWTWRATASP
eukprot:1334128-Rhodomonas_salina.1